MADFAASGHRPDLAVGRNEPNPGISKVGDIEIAQPVECEAVRTIEPCLAGRTAIAVRSWRTVAGEGGDGPLWRNDANAMIGGVGEVDRAVGFRRNPFHLAQERRCRGAAVADGIGPGERLDLIGDAAGLRPDRHRREGYSCQKALHTDFSPYH